MIIPVTVNMEGSIVTSAGPDSIVIKLFHDRNHDTTIRKISAAEAMAFIEYLGCNLKFQIGDYLIVDLVSETARDQLIADLEHAIKHMGVGA